MESMRVHELIKELSKCDPDTPVYLEEDSHEYEVSRIIIGDKNSLMGKCVLIK